MKFLNVRKSDTIVIYDKIGMVSAPRAFWLFKTFGIPNVMILNGSFHKWNLENKSIETGDVETAWRKFRTNQPSNDDFNFTLNQSHIRKYEEIVKIAKEKSHQIVDTRFAKVY